MESKKIHEKPAKLIFSAMETLPSAADVLTRCDLKLIRNNIPNSRLSVLPKMPKDLLEAQDVLQKINVSTVKGDTFLLKNVKDAGIVMFSCLSNLQCMCKCEVILVDETFDAAPKFFIQMFTVHGYYKENYIPFVFCLLKDKRKDSYAQSECDKRGLRFSPKTIVSDFERGIQESIRAGPPRKKEEFLLLSRWRKIQQLGLSRHYKERDSPTGRWLRYCFGLAYLSPEDVEVQKTTSTIDVDENTPYPPSTWAADSSDLWRTTNSFESFHSRFSSFFGATNPNIFIFVKNLNLIQSDTYIRINTAEASGPRKITKKELFINEKIAEFKNGKIGYFDFLNAVSYKTKTI
nr:uncharacterized protein LOC110283128 [Parasteatoda tepidariorum]